MAESFIIPNTESRSEIYEALIPQIKSILEAETDLIANLANTSAILKEALNFFWVGFYLVKGDELVLGPFQGTLACTRIQFGRGVCGTSAKEEKTIIVDNVDEFPGHIACSSQSKSEIVVPLIANGGTQLILDVDSDRLSDFSEIDQNYLEQIMSILKQIHF